MEYVWIKSHQDRFKIWHDLTIKQQLNCYCNFLTKDAVLQFQINKDRPNQCLPWGSTACPVDIQEHVSPWQAQRRITTIRETSGACRDWQALTTGSTLTPRKKGATCWKSTSQHYLQSMQNQGPTGSSSWRPLLWQAVIPQPTYTEWLRNNICHA